MCNLFLRSKCIPVLVISKLLIKTRHIQQWHSVSNVIIFSLQVQVEKTYFENTWMDLNTKGTPHKIFNLFVIKRSFRVALAEGNMGIFFRWIPLELHPMSQNLLNSLTRAGSWSFCEKRCLEKNHGDRKVGRRFGLGWVWLQPGWIVPLTLCSYWNWNCGELVNSNSLELKSFRLTFRHDLSHSSFCSYWREWWHNSQKEPSSSPVFSPTRRVL